jgi:hypothetical protein
MADAAAGSMPTFKLVLVGDGGTGKVRRIPSTALRSPARLAMTLRRRTNEPTHHDTDRGSMLTRLTTDDLRQAPFDRRVREEVHCDPRCRGTPSRLHHRTLTDPRMRETAY